MQFLKLTDVKGAPMTITLADIERQEMLEIIHHARAAINIQHHKMKGCEVEDCWACLVIRRIDRFLERTESEDVD